MKFNRTYNLVVDVGPYSPIKKEDGTPSTKFSAFTKFAENSVTIEPNYTIEFSIRREMLATAQTANFKIYNLGESTRDVIYKEWFNGGEYAGIEFRAGYLNQFMPVIFNGNIRSAYSKRVGRTNIVTEIDAYSGGFAQANSYSNFNLQPGSSLSDLINRLNQDLVKVAPTPIIGNVPSLVNQRSVVCVGPTYNIIQNILPVNVNATIDNNQLKVLGINDGFKVNEEIFVISSETGLLDIPERQGMFITCKMLFEPRLTIGQLVWLISKDIPRYNGIYPVQGLTHEGIISPAVNGPLTTLVNLYLGPNGEKNLSGGAQGTT